MSVLSLTFHSTSNISSSWDHYTENTLFEMIENLMDVENYILSDVESDMINEGKNTNLLLMFDNTEKRQEFIDIELRNITERIQGEFGDEVMVFVTLLNPKQK